MKPVLAFTRIDDDGVEHEYMLPGRYEVCPRCDGHGTHLTPSIAEHAYSREEFEEAFWDEEDRADYFRRGGKYDVICIRCNGQRVVVVIDEDACRTAEQREVLALYNEKQRQDAIYERQRAAELRWGY